MRCDKTGPKIRRHRKASPAGWGEKGPCSSLGLPLLSDELEEVLPEYQHPFADLMERQAFSPECPPPCLPDTETPLKFWQGIEFVGPDEAGQEF